jgi:hypothetical protein
MQTTQQTEYAKVQKVQMTSHLLNRQASDGQL